MFWVRQAAWSRVREVQQEFADVKTDSFFLGVHAQGIIWKLNGRLLRLQLSPNSAGEPDFQREADQLEALIQSTRDRLTTAGERNLALEVHRAFLQYRAETEPLLPAARRAVRKESAALAYQAILEKSEALLQACDRLAECQDQTLAARFETSKQALGELLRLMQLSTLLLLGCAAAIAVLAHRAIVTPLRRRLDQSEQTVVRQEKLASLGTLAAGVAHEIRNPLTAIKFRLFSFKRELPEPLAEHEDMTVIHGEIDRLERIVGDFLQFARPSDPQLTEIRADDLLRKLRGLLGGSLEKRGIALNLEATGPIRLMADQHQIEQVLINLVQNAADSIGQDGTVTLRATVADNGAPRSNPVVVFEVADTGQGIPPEAEERIFDPFYSTKDGGTGLGLPIAARIAEKHGGSIHCETQPGRGATFRLVLPGITDDATSNPPH
jgi:signal transduction histidine kinase